MKTKTLFPEITLNELIGKLSAIRNANQDIPSKDLKVYIAGTDYLQVKCSSAPIDGPISIIFGRD